MARKKPEAITDQELHRLYVDDGLGMRAIGRMVGLSAPSVLERLRKAGIPTRPKASLAREALEPLVASGLSKRQMSQALGLSPARIAQLLERYDLKATDGRSTPRHYTRKERTRSSGYWMLSRPEHPHADKRGRVMEHRLVMEATLGRYLRPEEVVHHMNHMKDDNRPENLMVLPNHAAHMRLHSPPGQPVAPGGNEARWGRR